MHQCYCADRLELQWFNLHLLYFTEAFLSFYFPLRGNVDSYSTLIESKTLNLRSRKLQLVSE